LKNKPHIGDLTAKQAQHSSGMKIQQNKKSAGKLNRKPGRHIRKIKPKMSKYSQKHAKITFSSKLKQQKFNKILNKKKQSEICKKQAQKPSKFQLNKPKNKQPASLQKNPQLHKNTSPNSRENRKLGNTDSGIVLIVKFPNYHCFWSQRIYYITIDVCSDEHGAVKILNLSNIQHMSAMQQ